MRIAAVMISIALLSACSKPVVDSYVPERLLSNSHLPDSISGVPVAIPTYEFRSCARLISDRAAILRDLRVAETAVELGLNDRTSGVTLLGQPFEALEKRQHDTLIGLAKMRIETINGIAIKRGCVSAGSLVPRVVDSEPIPLGPQADTKPFGHIK